MISTPTYRLSESAAKYNFNEASASSSTAPIVLGVPIEFEETPILSGIIPLASHSEISPSAANAGGVNDIVGIPLAKL